MEEQKAIPPYMDYDVRTEENMKVSIIINGVRYDAVRYDVEEGAQCLQCDLFKGICNIYSTTHCVTPLSRCPLKDGYIFKKSTKSFER